MINSIIPIAVLLILLLIMNQIWGIKAMYYMLILILLGALIKRIDTVKGWLK